MRISSKTGLLVGAWGLMDEDQIIAMTNRGRVIRMNVDEVSTLGRAATGYRVVKVAEGDMVADISVIRSGEGEGE